jgi:teichuronic acid biosynthesis glycosyltransferase TuaG
MLVSIVMPTFNRETYLAESINSIIEQTFKDWELIVIDDGSTDDTATLMDYYCKKDKRIKYLLNLDNKGISYSRNRGVAEAKGKFVAIMDSDDVASPNRLKKSLNALLKGPACDCVYSSYLQANEFGKVQGMIEPESPNKLNMKDILKFQMIPHVTMMGRKELFKYRDEYRTNDDLYLVASLFKQGVKFKKIREPLMIVRYHPTSTSNTKDKEVKKVTELIKEEFEKDI